MCPWNHPGEYVCNFNQHLNTSRSERVPSINFCSLLGVGGYDTLSDYTGGVGWEGNVSAIADTKGIFVRNVFSLESLSYNWSPTTLHMQYVLNAVSFNLLLYFTGNVQWSVFQPWGPAGRMGGLVDHGHLAIPPN